MYICLGKIRRKMSAIHMSVYVRSSERQWGKESIPHHFCKMKPSQTAQKQQPINDLTVECLSDRSISFWGNRKYRSFGNNESVSFLPLDSLCANDHHPLPFSGSIHFSVRLQNHMDDAFQAHEPLFARAFTTLILSAYFYVYKKNERPSNEMCSHYKQQMSIKMKKMKDIERKEKSEISIWNWNLSSNLFFSIPFCISISLSYFVNSAYFYYWFLFCMTFPIFPLIYTKRNTIIVVFPTTDFIRIRFQFHWQNAFAFESILCLCIFQNM